jgi:hypothetical protein
VTRSDFGKYTGITIMANNDTNPANVAIQQDPGLVVRTISPQVVEVYSPAPVVVGGTGNALALPNIIPTEPVYLRVQEDSANVVVKTAVMNFTGNAVTIIGQGSTATVQIDALGPASFGNWVFNGNTLYNFNGGIVDNSDDSHGATAFVRLPANGSGADPYQLLNYYGNITLTPGLNPGNTYNWTFDRTGNLTLPSNTAVIKYANGTPYGGSGNGTPGGSNTQIQYNNAGAFAGNAGLTFNQATGTLTATKISGNITAPGGEGQLLLNVGNIIGANIGLSYNANANMLYSNGVTAVGHPVTGVQGFYVGVPGYAVLGSAVLAQFTSDIDSYSQVNQQNINSGNLASADYIITADNGTDSTYYLDIGMASSNHADPDFFGDTTSQNDAYIYVTGADQAGPSSNAGPGNLIIGSTNGVIKMFVGNTAQANVVATVNQSGVSVAGNITGSNVNTGIITLTNGAVIKDNAGDSVAFGQSAGGTSQGNSAVALGQNAGATGQGTFAVAIGRNAGQTSQGGTAIAIGAGAGDTSQGSSAVAIGSSAGLSSQSANAVAIGTGAGSSTQRVDAVAIGNAAGSLTQGIAAVAIGALAGRTFQANNSIILNATGANLDQTTANTFTVAPVRNDVANTAEVMFYNATSKEVTYGNTISVAGNITSGNLSGNNLVINSITSDDSSFVTVEDGLNVAGDVNLSGDLVFSPTQVQSSAYAGGNGHAMMIDTNRTDTYVEIGSADKPFKTFAAAIAAVAAENPTGTVPYTFILMGCNINETVDFTPYNFNFITISTTCRSTFNDPVIFGNSALLQLTIRNVEFGDTVAITGDGTANQLNNTSIYNVSFVGALTVTAANALAFYEAAFFAPVVFNNVSYCYVNGGQFNDDWTIRVDDTGAYPIPSGGISPGVVLALDFIANDINFVKGGTGFGVFQPHSSRMGRTGQTYTLPASWILTAYSSAFLGNWVNDGTWTMRNSVNLVAIANTAPTYSGIIGGTTITATGNITGGNLTTAGLTSTASLSITGNTATVTTANYSIGYLNIPQISLAANTTTALTDSGKHYYSTSASNLALTIANNTSVSWPVGTAISIVNRGTANITIAGGTGVSLYLSGNSTAGNRTVTTYGMATVMNVAANIWMINGTVV